MAYYDNVNIPVFGVNADENNKFTTPSVASGGEYFSDVAWLSDDNTTRKNGVSDGIARSIDYNTVMRQCSVMSSLLAHVAAYRNSFTRGWAGATSYGGSTSTKIGADILGTELDGNGNKSMPVHLRNLAAIFSKENFLAPSEVLSHHINDGAVTTSKILNGNVTKDKLGLASVSRSKLDNDLIINSSSTQNGIKVDLIQTNDGGYGFSISVTSSKVTTAQDSDNSANVRSDTDSGTFYLCGVSSTTSGTNKRLKHNSSLIVTSGNKITANVLNVASDARLKDNIESLGKNQVRALVDGVDSKTFVYKDKPTETCVGMIAQDILAQNTVLGELLVSELKDTGLYQISESKLVYVLWDYVKQQSARITELGNKLEKLLERL